MVDPEKELDFSYVPQENILIFDVFNNTFGKLPQKLY